MNKLQIVKVISYIVIALSLTVLLGWIFNITALQNIIPQWTSLKFVNAICFLLSGLTLHFIALAAEGRNRVIDFLPFTSLLIFLITATLFATSLIGIPTGLENLFVTGKTDSLSVTVGKPSPFATIAFLFISVFSFLFMLNQAKFRRIRIALGSLVTSIGSLAMLGYIFRIPVLYYAFATFDTAISALAAFLFTLIGVALILASLVEIKRLHTTTTIKSRLLIAFLSVSFISTVLFGFITITSYSNTIRGEVSSKLKLLSEIKEGELFGYFTVLETRTIDFSSSEYIKERVRRIASGSSQATIELNNHLTKNKMTLDPSLTAILVINKEGIVIASTLPVELGKNKRADNDFILGKERVELLDGDKINDLTFPSPIIEVAAPITDSKSHGLIGVIINIYNTDRLGEILSGSLQIQKGALSSQETLSRTLSIHLVDREKKVVAHGHKKVERLVDTIDTLPVSECIQNEKETIAQYANHFGVNVIGSSMCIPEKRWTLITEIDSSEAFAVLNQSQVNMIIFTIVVLIFNILTALVTADKISEPIRALREGANIIGKGDLDHKVIVETGDETEALAEAINQMSINLKTSRENLQKYTEELEQTVAKRTSQLTNKVKDLQEAKLVMQNITQELQIKNKEISKSRDTVVHIMNDIRKVRDSLAEEKSKDEAILTSIGDAVIACDENGKIILFNGVAQTLTGYPLHDAIGKKYTSILNLVDEANEKEQSDFVASALKNGQRTEIAEQSLLVRADGQKIPVASSASPIKDTSGKIVGGVVVLRDVAHEREVDKAKTEFVSLASHQLRTPLSTINWYAEMLLSGDAGKISDDQRKYVQEAYRASKRMVELVNSLLNVSRLELGTFIVEPVPTNIIDLAKSSIKELKTQFGNKKIVLHEEYDQKLPRIPIDPKLLSIVFQNILTNAIKYTPEKGTIRLSISLQKGENVHITISDTGCGIPKNQQDKIFAKLFRADNARKIDADGTGLGLYIVRLIMINVGGEIWFESEENKGTTFHITLPIRGMKKKEGTKVLS